MSKKINVEDYEVFTNTTKFVAKDDIDSVLIKKGIMIVWDRYGGVYSNGEFVGLKTNNINDIVEEGAFDADGEANFYWKDNPKLLADDDISKLIKRIESKEKAKPITRNRNDLTWDKYGNLIWEEKGEK